MINSDNLENMNNLKNNWFIKIEAQQQRPEK
jgi:hypothetical protein